MATLFITEYEYLSKAADGHTVVAGKEPAHATQQVTFTGTAAASEAFAKGTRFVRIWSDTEAYILFGLNPTATTGQDTPVSAKAAEYWGVKADDKVSAVT